MLLKGMLCFVLLINLHTLPNRKGLTPLKGFLGSSAGKESACNAGDPGLIPGSGRSRREWIDYPLQYSWASLVVQLVKNTSAMQETWFHP